MGRKIDLFGGCPEMDHFGGPKTTSFWGSKTGHFKGSKRGHFRGPNEVALGPTLGGGLSVCVSGSKGEPLHITHIIRVHYGHVIPPFMVPFMDPFRGPNTDPFRGPNKGQKGTLKWPKYVIIFP